MRSQTMRIVKTLLRPLLRRSLPPVNYQSRDPSLIAADVEYAITIGENYLGILAQRRIGSAGTRLLEIGPGTDFGAMLILASHGIQTAVADKFLKAWDPNYHRDFYRALREKYSGPHSAIDAVIDAGGYVDSAIERIHEPAEHLASVPDASFDVVTSNAVLEHVANVPAVARTFARITKKGGLNIHQIDLRDHNDFSRPLEFLLLQSWVHRMEFKYVSGEIGNRVRLSQFITEFERAGFDILEVEKNSIADPEYLQAFIPRLRRSWSTYRDWSAEDLAFVSVKLTAKRT